MEKVMIHITKELRKKLTKYCKYNGKTSCEVFSEAINNYFKYKNNSEMINDIVDNLDKKVTRLNNEINNTFFIFNKAKKNKLNDMVKDINNSIETIRRCNYV